MPESSHAHGHYHDHQAAPSDLALRVKALESLLVEKGLVDRAALDKLIDAYEHKIGPRNGARVVARTWADPAYKQRLLTNADAAIADAESVFARLTAASPRAFSRRASCCASASCSAARPSHDATSGR